MRLFGSESRLGIVSRGMVQWKQAQTARIIALMVIVAIIALIAVVALRDS